MKRVDLIRHLEQHGCVLVREGAKHSIYRDRSGTNFSSVPRHREVKSFLAKKICQDLNIPVLEKR